MLVGNLLAVGAIHFATQDGRSLHDLAGATTIIGGGIDLAIAIDRPYLISGIRLDDDALFVLGNRNGGRKIASARTIGAAIIAARDVGNIRTAGATGDQGE